jgi:hypothetical protein
MTWLNVLVTILVAIVIFKGGPIPLRPNNWQGRCPYFCSCGSALVP